MRAPNSHARLFSLDMSDRVVLINPLSLLSVKGLYCSFVDGLGQEGQGDSFCYIEGDVQANQKREEDSRGKKAAEFFPAKMICLVNGIMICIIGNMLFSKLYFNIIDLYLFKLVIFRLSTDNRLLVTVSFGKVLVSVKKKKTQSRSPMGKTQNMP